MLPKGAHTANGGERSSKSAKLHASKSTADKPKRSILKAGGGGSRRVPGCKWHTSGALLPPPLPYRLSYRVDAEAGQKREGAAQSLKAPHLSYRKGLRCQPSSCAGRIGAPLGKGAEDIKRGGRHQNCSRLLSPAAYGPIQQRGLRGFHPDQCRLLPSVLEKRQWRSNPRRAPKAGLQGPSRTPPARPERCDSGGPSKKPPQQTRLDASPGNRLPESVPAPPLHGACPRASLPGKAERHPCPAVMTGGARTPLSRPVRSLHLQRPGRAQELLLAPRPETTPCLLPGLGFRSCFAVGAGEGLRCLPRQDAVRQSCV